MIKVFKNRVYLYTVTTALLSLLQHGVGVGANVGGYRASDVDIIVTPLNEYINGGEVPVRRDDITVPPSSSPPKIHGISVSVFPERKDVPISDGYNRLSGIMQQSLRGESGENGRREYNAEKLTLYDGLYYICDDCGSRLIDSRSSYKITQSNLSQYPSNATAITVKGKDTIVVGENITVGSEVSGETFLVGAYVLENGKIVLEDPILKDTIIALRASNGVIEVKNGKIEESYEGVEAAENSFVLLEDTKIKTDNGIASLLSYENSEVWMERGSVDFINSHGVSSTLGGKIHLDDVTITGKDSENKNHAVLHTDLGGPINFKGIIKAVNVHGILSENTVATSNSILSFEDLSDNVGATEVNLESSDVKVSGNRAYGIYFKGEKSLQGLANEEASEEEKTPRRLEVVNLQRTVFSAQDHAIYSTNKTFGVVSLTQSTLSSDSLLLKAEDGASVAVLAVASTLEGGAYVDEDSTAKFYLGDSSTWILQSKQKREQDDSALKDVSSVSLVNLISGSSIKFTLSKPNENYIYQTLHIGKGTGEVYKAQEGAHIYLNTYLNFGGALGNQQTDRVLIHGDVSGKTTVHVRGVSGSPGAFTGNGGNEQGISIIQVSGTAEKDSFLLEGGYVTADYSPYQYQLYAYGPQSPLGKASVGQRLVKGSGDFWDFRLQNRYVEPKPDPAPAPSPAPTPSPTPPPEPGPRPTPSPEPRPKPEIKAVVPQVPTYLLLPNALFQVGLMNINSQNNRLEALRIASGGLLKNDEQPAFFVRGYGGSYRYASNLSTFEYGYGGELDYHAVEAGALLQTIENAHSNASLGVIGSYERFSLQPLDVEQSQKSAFDKWSVIAYGGIQHDAGCYVDTLLSYGLFKGDVLTLARGKTATLKGKPLSASVTAGKIFMIGDEGFVVDPQVQVVYQHLHFDKTRDIDDFDIDMGKLDQWVVRVGGQLTKTLSATDEAGVVSFYSKLYLSHGLADKKFVHFKDAFQLGAFGSSLEAGLGFNAKLSQKFALHGDVSYQHKLTKAGFSGASFSGGVRYQF
ncbi:autotransporter outer membrane beta-barrel domain-containing protein [Bartonella sp. 220]|uniref:autotransporter family protein n=1 Tax=Bartonella sp. 220B TaxID=2967260 RepID=UPI0022A98F46|nr:autotransporter outer membrane beta-barrel domain-containing protein [Bartonella sp. 220B]MCZ2159075.1 autotransporter outer membrane beta-barrel domain-containing protein [Bartonella sp. 220B]